MVRTLKPTWRSLRLATDLRRLRENAELSCESVGEQLNWDKSKVSRIETSKSYVSVSDCEQLLDLYGADTRTRTSLLDLARNAKKRGWWTAYRDVFSGTFMDMEDVAEEIDNWETEFIPGLLQTPEYARNIIQTAMPTASEDDVERRLRARMARKPLLQRANPPTLVAVLDEAVFRRMQVDPTVLSGQIHALLEAPNNVSVQVLPFATGWNRGMEGPFVVLKFGTEIGQPKAYIDTPGGHLYVENVEDVRRCTLTFEAVRDAASTPEESADWLDRLAKECSRR